MKGNHLRCTGSTIAASLTPGAMRSNRLLYKTPPENRGLVYQTSQYRHRCRRGNSLSAG